MLERIGRYELLATLGSGGMGEVFAARLRGESQFQRLYAIKRIRRDISNDERFVSMFFDEARTAACIHSPNVVPVLDVGRDHEGAPYMVMELVIGTSFHALTRVSDLSLEVAWALVVDAARGLRDAHTTVDPYGQPLHIVHRDVSPRNILLGIDGHARITDFGVAKSRRQSAPSSPGEVKGSYPYFSPEHIHGMADAQSDIFSLAIVAWELLSGRRLFDRSTPAAVLESVATAPIPRLSELRPGLPVALERVIDRALLRDRSRRWHSAEDLVRALESVDLVRPTPQEVGRIALDLAESLIATVRGLDETGISEAKTILAVVDTLVDGRFESPTRDARASPTLGAESTAVDEDAPTRTR